MTSPMASDDETARVLKEAILSEALRDDSSAAIIGRMLDTYAGICRREGAKERPVGQREGEGEIDVLTPEDFDLGHPLPDPDGFMEMVPDAGKEEEAVSDDESGQHDWRDVEPPESVTFDIDEMPHGAEIVVTELIRHHNNPEKPNWAVYMGLLERLPNVPGEFLEFEDLHSAADPWDEETAREALEDLMQPTEGCFAVHGDEPRHSDPGAVAITEVGQEISKWWRREKYNQLQQG